MSASRVFILVAVLVVAHAGSIPSNIIGIDKVIDIPNKVSNFVGFGKGNSSDGTTTVMGNFGTNPDQIFGSNTNKTTNNTNGIGDLGSMITGIPNKVFGSNKTECNGFGSVISGFPNAIFGNRNKTGSGSSNFSSWFPDIGSYFGNSNKTNNETSAVAGTQKNHRKRSCKHCSHHHEGEHMMEKKMESSRPKRQTLLGNLGSGASNFSSLASGLGPGNLGNIASSLSNAAADATLVMGMFQVLVKPMKGLAEIGGLTDIMKNPQNILTQPQTLLNGSDTATDEVEVSGALALVLLVSRAAGVAPLWLTRARAGHRIAVSAPIATVSRVVMMIFNTIMLTGLALDFLEEPPQRIRAGESTLKAVVWIGDMALVMLVANIAVLAGPARMRDLIRVLKQLKQIKYVLKMEETSVRVERFKCVAIVCMLFWSVFTQVTDFANLMQTAVKDGKRWSIMCMYVTYYYANMLGMLVMLQWCSAALGTYGAAAALNRQLDELNQASVESESRSELCVSSSPISTLVDFNFHGKPKEAESYTHAQATIRRLALSYERVSGVVRQLNDGNGAILIAMLTSICLRLVLTPYYLLLGLFDEDDVVALVVVIQVCWSLFHINNLLLIVEPCHWTHEQRERTEILIGQLMVHLAPRCEAASRDLDRFAKQVQLSHASFMPLGIYTLARPLMVTILGGVTTYLVIIIQFQKISNLL